MDICQDEGCPNYVIDELNKCITFKQVSECPTPDYLKGNKEPVAQSPAAMDGSKARNLKRKEKP